MHLPVGIGNPLFGWRCCKKKIFTKASNNNMARFPLLMRVLLPWLHILFPGHNKMIIEMHMVSRVMDYTIRETKYAIMGAKHALKVKPSHVVARLCKYFLLTAASTEEWGWLPMPKYRNLYFADRRSLWVQIVQIVSVGKGKESGKKLVLALCVRAETRPTWLND